MVKKSKASISETNNETELPVIVTENEDSQISTNITVIETEVETQVEVIKENNISSLPAIKEQIGSVGIYNELLTDMEKLKVFAAAVVEHKLFPTIKNTTQVITAVLLANDLCIPPLIALTLHHKLDDKAVLSIERGKRLGLDWLTSVENVYVIPGKNGNQVTTVGVHIINAIIQKSNIIFTILKDFAPLYMYDDRSGISHKEKDILTTPNNYFICSSGSTENDMNKAEEEGKTVVIRTKNVYTYGTVIEFTKTKGTKEQPLRIGYTLEDAQIACLYGLVDNKGNITGGKDNWNKHPAIMCRNRVFSIAGRILVPDKLNTVYLVDEIES